MHCWKEVFLKNFASTLGETSRNQTCLNLMGASNIVFIIGQLLLQLWGMVVRLHSLLTRQRSWEQKLTAWTYHSLFPLRTDLPNNKANNSYTMTVWGFYPVKFKSTLFTQDFWPKISHIGETRSGSTHTTKLNKSQDDSWRCSVFNQGFMKETF